MSSIQITGQVMHVNNPAQAGNFNFQSAIVLINPGEYQSYIEVQFSGNSLASVATLQPNTQYLFSINIRGSKNALNSTRTPGDMVAYTTFSVWKVEPAGQAQQAPQNNNFNAAPQQNNFGNQGAAQPNQNFGGQPQGTVGVPQNNNNFNQPTQQQQGFGSAPSNDQNGGGFGQNQPQQQSQGFGQQAPNNFGGNNNGGFGGQA